MGYEDYLPEYPPIGDEDFYRRIANKAEFWEKSDADSFFQHQVNIARYLSQWTLYNSLFLFHEMGTGKSGLTVALTEHIRPRTKVLYITHNQTQIDNYKMEIYKFSPRLSAGIEMGVDIDSQERFRKKWNSALHKDGYEFFTLGTISGELSRRPAAWLKEKYEGSVILLDEAHHLVQTNKDEEKKSYHTILQLVDLLESRKLIVMTGTPVRDQPDEIIPILNMVLPPARRLQRNEFIRDFFETERRVSVLDQIQLPVYRWKEDRRKVFQDLIRGRVSYLRRETTGVRVEYVGSVCKPMDSLRLCVNEMSVDGVQNLTYLDVFQDEAGIGDDEDDGDEDGDEEDAGAGLLEGVGGTSKRVSFYSKSKQASLFVFPGGLYGDKGFSRFVSRNYTLSKTFLQEFGADLTFVSKDEILRRLASFSSTYARVLTEIVNNPRELVYVFSDLVEGSGILLFLALLKSLFHFQVVASPRDIQYTTGDRVICLNDKITDEDHYQQLISYFNDPGNKNGEYCQIILSTNKTKEGISLKNVQQVHIMTPSWNMADTSQAIARSLRARSHVDLPDPRVRIFLHTSTPAPPEELPPDQNIMFFSIDFQRYFRSEIKDRNTKLLERVFLESSWDCLMNLPVNSNTGRLIDGSIECEYSSCKYSCHGVDAGDPRGQDRANLNLFYSNIEQDHLLSRIQEFFKRRCVARRREVIDFVSRENPVLAEKVLWDVMYTPIPVRTDQGDCFLTQDGNIYFLVDNPFLPAPGVYASYYYQHPASVIDFPISPLLDSYYMDNIRQSIQRLLRLIRSDNPNARDFFMAFPLTVQRLFCEISIEASFLQSELLRVPLRQWFIDNFKTDITFIPDVLIDHRFVEDKKKPRRLDLKNPRAGWLSVQ